VSLGTLAGLAGGCDTGTQNNASLGIGPPIHVVGFNGANDAGGNTLPTDGIIQIAFDRLLHPSSVTRQSFSLVDETGVFPEPVVTYDPVARVVSLSNPNLTPGPWLTPGVTYTVTMGVSAANDYTGGSGPRAIDGAVLPAQVVEVFQAVTPASATPSADRLVDFCADVLPIFQYRCTQQGSCHGSPPSGVSNAAVTPAEGLILQTAGGVRTTVIGTGAPLVAEESNTGPLAQPAAAQGKPFGVDMPLVTLNPASSSGNPGASWLLYKVLRGQVRPVDDGVDAGFATCGAAAAPLPVLQLPTPQPPEGLTLPASEQEILSQYILGNEMPYPLGLPNNESTATASAALDCTQASGAVGYSCTLPLTFDELERVRAWITQGATVPAGDCTACATECAECPSP
jgi:hypothetical protein